MDPKNFGDEDPMEVDVPEKVVFGVDIGEPL